MNAIWPLKMDPSEKAVLIALADAAREPDDTERPCQAWPAMCGKDGKIGLVERTCLSERTIQRAIKSLVTMGLLKREQVRHRVYYTILVQSADALTPVTMSPDSVTPDSVSVTPVTVTPKSLLTLISSEPKGSSEHTGPARSTSKSHRSTRIPTDWVPSRLPGALGKLVDQWPADRLQRELDGFRDYWASRNRDAARIDWDKVWHNRIRDVHDRIMREATYGKRGNYAPGHSGVPL